MVHKNNTLLKVMTTKLKIQEIQVIISNVSLWSTDIASSTSKISYTYINENVAVTELKSKVSCHHWTLIENLSVRNEFS